MMASQMTVNVNLGTTRGLAIGTQFEITRKVVGILCHNGKFEYYS